MTTIDASIIGQVRSDDSARRHAARWEQAVRALEQVVEVDRDRRGGAPVLKGTRFPVGQVFSQLAEGDTVKDLAEEFKLDQESIRTLLRAVSDILSRPKLP